LTSAQTAARVSGTTAQRGPVTLFQSSTSPVPPRAFAASLLYKDIQIPPNLFHVGAPAFLPDANRISFVMTNHTDAQFTPGVSIDAPPTGDVERQAVASLRGYAYQVAAATIAWLDLDSTGKVYLEVAEDYAIVAGSRLKASRSRLARRCHPHASICRSPECRARSSLR
jgi:hypothetical protein